MSVFSIIMLEEGFNRGIRCRYASRWFKVDSYVPGKEGLLAEIERNKPDVVVMDLGLYAKIDGIKTSWKIRNWCNVPVIYGQG